MSEDYDAIEAKWADERERATKLKEAAEFLGVPMTIDADFARQPIDRSGVIKGVALFEKEWLFFGWRLCELFDSDTGARNYIKSLPKPEKSRKFRVTDKWSNIKLIYRPDGRLLRY